MRHGPDPDDFLIVAANWTPVPREGYRIGIPAAGRYRQLLDSDDERWGGSGSGVFTTLESSPEPAHRRPYSLLLTLPPLAIVYLKPVRRRRPAPAS
jgi:1,4-alpha-glucan branching enzyme